MAYRPRPRPPPLRANRVRTPHAGYGNAQHGVDVDAGPRYSESLDDMFDKRWTGATRGRRRLGNAFGEQCVDEGMRRGRREGYMEEMEEMEEMDMHGGARQASGRRVHSSNDPRDGQRRNRGAQDARPAPRAAWKSDDAHPHQGHQRDGHHYHARGRGNRHSESQKPAVPPNKRSPQDQHNRRGHHRDRGHHPEHRQHPDPLTPQQNPPQPPKKPFTHPPQNQNQNQNQNHKHNQIQNQKNNPPPPPPPSPQDTTPRPLHDLASTAVRQHAQLLLWTRDLERVRASFEKRVADARAYARDGTREGERRARGCLGEAEREFRGLVGRLEGLGGLEGV